MAIDPEELDEELDDEVDEVPDNLVRTLRGVTKEQKKRIRELETQVSANQEAVKKLAFIEADLPDTPQMKFFLDHYEGEYTGDAIKAKAAEYGFLEVSDEISTETNEIEQMMNASRGAQQVAAPGTDRALQERIKSVKPGPKAAEEIAQIMKDFGRYQDDE